MATDKLILKFIWKLKGPKIAEIILKKKQGWKTDHFWFQNLAKSYSSQDSVVMA